MILSPKLTVSTSGFGGSTRCSGGAFSYDPTPEEDVATVKRTLGRVSIPAILVGHSYGGSVITAAGTDGRVAGLVYIAALAPDADETSQSQQAKFPVTDVFKRIEVADGRVWLRPVLCGRLIGARAKDCLCNPLCARCGSIWP